MLPCFFPWIFWSFSRSFGQMYQKSLTDNGMDATEPGFYKGQEHCRSQAWFYLLVISYTVLLGAAAHIPPLELQCDTLATQPALLSLGWSSPFLTMAILWTSPSMLLLAWALPCPAIPEDCIFGWVCKNKCPVSGSKSVVTSTNSSSGFENLDPAER